jgi:DTW domain-containing protein YfiP
VVLAMHVFEDRKSSNTGRLAAECLPNSEVVLHGQEGATPFEVPLPAGTQPLLLFPSEDARPIEAFRGHEQPLVLVVPDGTWRQANRLRNRVLRQRAMPSVLATPAQPSAYRLRTGARELGLSTLEAIARALGALEGQPIESALLGVFRIFVERSLLARSGVPSGP